MPPLSTRIAPNQMTATLEMFTTTMTVGNMYASSLPTASETPVRSAFASRKRSFS